MNRYRRLGFWFLFMTLPLWSAEEIVPDVIGVVTNVPHSAFAGEDYFTTNSPSQVGKARRSSPILYAAIYRLPVDLSINSEIYNESKLAISCHRGVPDWFFNHRIYRSFHINVFCLARLSGHGAGGSTIHHRFI